MTMKYTYAASDKEKNAANENLSHALLSRVARPLDSMLDNLDKIERALLLIKAAASDFPYQGLAHEFHSTRETLAKLVVVMNEFDIEIEQKIQARRDTSALNEASE